MGQFSITTFAVGFFWDAVHYARLQYQKDTCFILSTSGCLWKPGIRPKTACFIAAITDDNLRFSPIFQTNPNLICHYLRWFLVGASTLRSTQCGDLHIMTLSDGPSGRVICRGFHFWCSFSGDFWIGLDIHYDPLCLFVVVELGYNFWGSCWQWFL